MSRCNGEGNHQRNSSRRPRRDSRENEAAPRDSFWPRHEHLEDWWFHGKLKIRDNPGDTTSGNSAEQCQYYPRNTDTNANDIETDDVGFSIPRATPSASNQHAPLLSLRHDAAEETGNEPDNYTTEELQNLSDDEILKLLPRNQVKSGHATRLNRCKFGSSPPCKAVASADCQGFCTKHFCELVRSGLLHIARTGDLPLPIPRTATPPNRDVEQGAITQVYSRSEIEKSSESDDLAKNADCKLSLERQTETESSGSNSPKTSPEQGRHEFVSTNRQSATRHQEEKNKERSNRPSHGAPGASSSKQITRSRRDSGTSNKERKRERSKQKVDREKSHNIRRSRSKISTGDIVESSPEDNQLTIPQRNHSEQYSKCVGPMCSTQVLGKGLCDECEKILILAEDKRKKHDRQEEKCVRSKRRPQNDTSSNTNYKAAMHQHHAPHQPERSDQRGHQGASGGCCCGQREAYECCQGERRARNRQATNSSAHVYENYSRHQPEHFDQRGYPGTGRGYYYDEYRSNEHERTDSHYEYPQATRPIVPMYQPPTRHQPEYPAQREHQRTRRHRHDNHNAYNQEVPARTNERLEGTYNHEPRYVAPTAHNRQSHDHRDHDDRPEAQRLNFEIYAPSDANPDSMLNNATSMSLEEQLQEVSFIESVTYNNDGHGRCISRGCTNFGNANRGYCNECFKKRNTRY